ncbi:MAG: ParB/RepB/Spo0J family partition protein [Hyphomicrobiales bacterium]|nr:ParB/RepB/Spo0J family partition protein [Hyphomicrobiales bacterium]
MTHETTTIALNKLVAWDGNVRKTGVTDGLDELAASIAAHGLLQSLVVRPIEKGKKRGKYAVVAGQRRLLALQSLAKAKTIALDADIPCVIAHGDSDAAELSLAENTVRMPMHPADQFEAFRSLIDEGAGIADVAARFGVSETLVTKRMKLGRVSPVILDAYRKGEIDLDLVQAFTVSDDHEAQERVFNDLPAWNMHPRSIKEALTEGEIPASDKRVRFVGLEAYAEAGGALRRDLFDPENGGTILDASLLDRMVAGKLEAVADELRAEGWKWVEIVPDADYEYLSGFDRLYPERVPLSEADQAEYESLTAEYDEIVDSDDEADADRCEAIDKRLDLLNEREETWPEQTLAIAGVIVGLRHGGDIRIERGLVRPEDRPARPKDKPERSEPAKPAVALSAKLVEDLTAQKTAAIAAELMHRPDTALAAVVHALALPVFYTCTTDWLSLQISARKTGLRKPMADADSCKGLTALEAEADRWKGRLPGNPTDLWSWCFEQPRETLLDLLAVIAAHTVNAIVTKHERPKAHADMLARAGSLNVADYFTPTAENFFSRINGASIQAAISEAKGVAPAPGWAKLKKAELAKLAERQIAETGWLPEPLRIGDATVAINVIKPFAMDDDADDSETDDEEAFDELAEAAE